MQKQPKLAIVVVTFQRQALLQVLLDSIKALNTAPVALIVVDNEDSAKTRELVAATAMAGTEVHYVPMLENTGGSGGFSKGVETAYGLPDIDWIWLMDDDVKLFPESLERLAPWLERAVVDNTLAIQIRRKNFDGTDFYWQYDFKQGLGIPNPVAPAAFAPNETYKPINTMCYEGGLVHRDLVKQIGLPDARFFIYWDDTIYGYLANKVTQPILINETLMQRTRPLDHIKIGRIRKLNSTSDMTRFYIMRNRGYMAQYFKLNGDYRPLAFAFGTFLTLSKEVIRLLLAKVKLKSLKILLRGMKEGKALRRDKTWRPMPRLDE